MAIQSKEEKNAYNRVYQVEHREEIRLRRRDYLPVYLEENREKVAAQQAAWYQKNTGRRKAYMKKYRRDLKMEVLSKYGEVCQFCGEAEPEFLTLDHIEGGGNAHRRTLGDNGSMAVYRDLKKQGFPLGYRCLCLNCNVDAYHAREKMPTVWPVQEAFRKRLREVVLNAYGAKCACCGHEKTASLTLDHVEGGGKKHRKNLSMGVLSWAKREGFPKSLRCLCQNCNLSAHFGGGVCIHQRVK